MLPTEPIRATIDDLVWITGRWHGERGTDRYEETWAEPSGGSMLGMFRLQRDGEPRFYELLAIGSENGGAVFRFRHFDPALVAWEERDAPLTFDLVATAEAQAVFAQRDARRWLTYRIEPDGGLLVAFDTGTAPRSAGDEFRFRRG
ncbi:MAG: DUF6265 family protein [Candidatus Limnocylindria bacterium]